MTSFLYLATLICSAAIASGPRTAWAQGDFQPVPQSIPSSPTANFPTNTGSNQDSVKNHMSPPYWGAESPVQQAFPTPYGPGYQLPGGREFQTPHSVPSAKGFPSAEFGNNPTSTPIPVQPNQSGFRPASGPQSILTRPSQVWESAISGSSSTAVNQLPLEISPPNNAGQNPDNTLPMRQLAAPPAAAPPAAAPPAAAPPAAAPPAAAPPAAAPHWTVPTHPAWNAAVPHSHFTAPPNPPHGSYQQQPNGYYAPQEPQPTVPFSSEPSLYEKGFRSMEPTYRPESWDSGQSFAFEQKKSDYPPLSEILRTGRYFVMTEWQFLRPQITALGGITIDSGSERRTRTLDYEQESAPRFRAGFESRFGPGVEFEYFQFDHDSRSLDAFSSVSDSVFTQVELPTLGASSQLQSTAANQQLSTRHDLELHSLGMSFFKEFKLPKARMNGTFGWRYVSIAQTQLSRLENNSGIELARLAHSTDFRGLGPRFGFEYYRPIGHTKLEFIGTFNTSLLFGNRDQIVFNTQQGYDERLGANEFVANFDIFGGAQYVKPIGENRAVYARLGVITQTWLGGGNGAQADGHFGLRGLSFAVGWNR